MPTPKKVRLAPWTRVCQTVLYFKPSSCPSQQLNCYGRQNVCVSVAESCLTLRNPMDCSPPGCPWNFPGKNTGVGSHSLLQGIFPTQGSKPGLLHCRQILYHLSHQENLVGREWAPKDVHILIPRTCEHVRIHERKWGLLVKWPWDGEVIWMGSIKQSF